MWKNIPSLIFVIKSRTKRTQVKHKSKSTYNFESILTQKYDKTIKEIIHYLFLYRHLYKSSNQKPELKLFSAGNKISNFRKRYFLTCG